MDIKNKKGGLLNFKYSETFIEEAYNTYLAFVNNFLLKIKVGPLRGKKKEGGYIV